MRPGAVMDWSPYTPLRGRNRHSQTVSISLYSVFGYYGNNCTTCTWLCAQCVVCTCVYLSIVWSFCSIISVCVPDYNVIIYGHDCMQHQGYIIKGAVLSTIDHMICCRADVIPPLLDYSYICAVACLLPHAHTQTDYRMPLCIRAHQYTCRPNNACLITCSTTVTHSGQFMHTKIKSHQ